MFREKDRKRCLKLSHLDSDHTNARKTPPQLRQLPSRTMSPMGKKGRRVRWVRHVNILFLLLFYVVWKFCSVCLVCLFFFLCYIFFFVCFVCLVCLFCLFCLLGFLVFLVFPVFLFCLVCLFPLFVCVVYFACLVCLFIWCVYANQPKRGNFVRCAWPVASSARSVTEVAPSTPVKPVKESCTTSRAAQRPRSASRSTTPAGSARASMDCPKNDRRP